MGGAFDICVEDSLIGGCYRNTIYSGLLSRQMTILSSPQLLAPYVPRVYRVKPRFYLSAIVYGGVEEDCYRHGNKSSWPIFTLHSGMRFYTRIQDNPLCQPSCTIL